MEGCNQIGAREGSVAAGESRFEWEQKAVGGSEGKRCWRLQLRQPGTLSHTVNVFQGPSPGLTPNPQGRTHPSFPSCSLEICHFQGRRWQPADFLLGLPGSCLLVLFQNGEVECSFTPCPELDCPREEWWLGPGQCCYACREPVPMTGEGHPACIPGRTQLQAGKQRGVRLSFVH